MIYIKADKALKGSDTQWCGQHYSGWVTAIIEAIKLYRCGYKYRRFTFEVRGSDE